jgi:hypothetical protein
MRRYYLGNLTAAVFGLLPILTGLTWVLYELRWKYKPNWGDPKGLTLFLCLPTIMAVGLIPQTLFQIWLMSKYGPEFELLPSGRRYLVDQVPIVSYCVSTILAFLAFVFMAEGRIPLN